MTTDTKFELPADATVTGTTQTSTVDDTVWVRVEVNGYPEVFAESDHVKRREANMPQLQEQAMERLQAMVRPAPEAAGPYVTIEMPRQIAEKARDAVMNDESQMWGHHQWGRSEALNAFARALQQDGE